MNPEIKLDADMLRELVTTAINEARKPDPVIAKQMAEAARLEARARRGMRYAAMEEQRQSEYRQRNCQHKKEDGRYALSGQMTNDGLVTQICSHCQGLWKSKPSTEVSDLINSGDHGLNGIQPLGKRLPVCDVDAINAAMAADDAAEAEIAS